MLLRVLSLLQWHLIHHGHHLKSGRLFRNWRLLYWLDVSEHAISSILVIHCASVFGVSLLLLSILSAFPRNSPYFRWLEAKWNEKNLKCMSYKSYLSLNPTTSLHLMFSIPFLPKQAKQRNGNETSFLETCQSHLTAAVIEIHVFFTRDFRVILWKNFKFSKIGLQFQVNHIVYLYTGFNR